MKILLIYAIHCYRKLISPLFPPTCRFYPTCSQYALEAVTKYGAIKGGWLALKRLSKCQPYHPWWLPSSEVKFYCQKDRCEEIC